MNRYVGCVVACIIGASPPAFAQSNAGSAMRGDPALEAELLRAQGDRVVPKSETSEAQRRILWADKVQDSAGFFRVRSTAGYVELVASFFHHPEVVKQSNHDFYKHAQEPAIAYAGKLDEGEDRISYLFGEPQAGAVLTVWPYAKHGVKITRYEEAFNQSVGDSPAILSLSSEPASQRALWKLVWFKRGVSYELYVTDTKDDKGNPAKIPAQIVQLGASLAFEVN
jgi:hypothetical protein